MPGTVVDTWNKKWDRYHPLLPGVPGLVGVIKYKRKCNTVRVTKQEGSPLMTPKLPSGRELEMREDPRTEQGFIQLSHKMYERRI